MHSIRETGVSIVIVEQNARRCLEICDRGYVLDQGKNAYTGSGRELLDDPKVVQLYLGRWGRLASPRRSAGESPMPSRGEWAMVGS